MTPLLDLFFSSSPAFNLTISSGRGTGYWMGSKNFSIRRTSAGSAVFSAISKRNFMRPEWIALLWVSQQQVESYCLTFILLDMRWIKYMLKQHSGRGLSRHKVKGQKSMPKVKINWLCWHKDRAISEGLSRHPKLFDILHQLFLHQTIRNQIFQSMQPLLVPDKINQRNSPWLTDWTEQIIPGIKVVQVFTNSEPYPSRYRRHRYIPKVVKKPFCVFWKGNLLLHFLGWLVVNAIEKVAREPGT